MYIEIIDLTFKYRNLDQYVLKDLDISVEKGEIVAILGESGSGKSTLLRLLAGLETPNGGEITINNFNVADKSVFIEPEKRGIGMVFQDYALFPHMTVEKNIKFGLNKLEKKERDMRVQSILSLVHMNDFSKRYPYELSGGQQQRIALARAVAPGPKLLLLDEPFSNLDAMLQDKIRLELKEILKNLNITTILVTHDVEDAKAIADRIIRLDKGKVVSEEYIVQ